MELGLPGSKHGESELVGLRCLLYLNKAGNKGVVGAKPILCVPPWFRILPKMPARLQASQLPTSQPLQLACIEIDAEVSNVDLGRKRFQNLRQIFYIPLKIDARRAM